MPANKSNLLTTGQAAKLCEVTPDTVLKWIRKGRLRGGRTAGGHFRINLIDGEKMKASEHRELERDVREDFSFDYADDEISFGIDRGKTGIVVHSLHET